VLPTLIDIAMGNETARAERARFVPKAGGVVLELGAGAGLSIPMYGSGVRKLYGLDPSGELLAKARPRGEGARFPVEFVQGRRKPSPSPTPLYGC
jgi:ubiquinone/menaquinone biosynthesis C-methylase UbiE